MFCGKCGYKVRDDDNFCPRCGRELVPIVDTNFDTISDENAISQERQVKSALLKKQVEEILIDLKPREREVIKMRFGIDDNQPKTLEEVGRRFDVTRERIRQIEQKALRKLRIPE